MEEMKKTWPVFAEDEILAASAVLRSGRVNYWTGEEGRSFEAEFANYVGVKHAVAVANGSVALDAILVALGIRPGEEVIVPPRSFVATASCVALRGAAPVFVDVDRDSQNISPDYIEQSITPRTRAIIVVHLAGWPCEMDPILAIAQKHGLFVIEDCAQAHGAVYRGRPVGSLGHVAAFSFCQDKIMTTAGEGGMVVTNDEATWRRVWEYKDHGKNFDAVQKNDGGVGFRWVHDALGTNLRMTEFQAAIGRIQLRKLPLWLTRRRRNAELFREGLSGLRVLRIPVPPEHCAHAYYKFCGFIEAENLRAGWSRDRIVAEIVSKGVPCFTGGCSEIYLEKVFQEKRLNPAVRLANARMLGETCIVFQVHPTLADADIQRWAESARSVLEKASA